MCRKIYHIITSKIRTQYSNYKKSLYGIASILKQDIQSNFIKIKTVAKMVTYVKQEFGTNNFGITDNYHFVLKNIFDAENNTFNFEVEDNFKLYKYYKIIDLGDTLLSDISEGEQTINDFIRIEVV